METGAGRRLRRQQGRHLLHRADVEGGALWAIAEEPGAAHVVGRSRDMGTIFFAEVLPLRIGSGALKPLDEKTGFIGDPKVRTFQPASAPNPPAYPTAWLPTERVARAWQAVVTGKEFEK